MLYTKTEKCLDRKNKHAYNPFTVDNHKRIVVINRNYKKGGKN